MTNSKPEETIAERSFHSSVNQDNSISTTDELRVALNCAAKLY